MYLKEIRWDGVVWINLEEYGPMTRGYERGNESSGCINDGEFIYQHSTC
jgi:hypothetical protein